MKVVAFNGSPRKDGNTATLIREVQKELDGQGIETEIVHLKGPIQGCIACFKCYEKRTRKCALDKKISKRLHRENGKSRWNYSGLSYILLGPYSGA